MEKVFAFKSYFGTAKIAVTRDEQRKFWLETPEGKRRLSRARALKLAKAAAKADNLNPVATVADHRVAARKTHKPTLHWDTALIREGTRADGARVALYAGAFGRCTLLVAGKVAGEFKNVWKADGGLAAFGAALVG
jgi:hypothetical protein